MKDENPAIQVGMMVGLALLATMTENVSLVTDAP